MRKKYFWDRYSTWETAEKAWEVQAKEAKKSSPNRSLKYVPDMISITKKTAKHLEWKAIQHLLFEKDKHSIVPHLFRHPLRYGIRYIQALIRKQRDHLLSREGDFFLYGVDSLASFEKEIVDLNYLLVVGFSYCEKPFECPSQRFTSECIHDPKHPICQQCPIGKAMNALPHRNVFPHIITTVHHIGDILFKLRKRYPHKKILFMITACELVLKMFGNWSEILQVEGVGIRFTGRICNTMESFRLAEKGVKPGLTVITDSTKKRFLHLIRIRREEELKMGRSN